MNGCRTKLRSVQEIYALEPYFIYANGSREHHFWLIQGYLQRVEAGKRSAAARKAKYGTTQPVRKLPNEPERNALPFGETPERAPNGPRTRSNGAEPSSSSSSSFSDSNLNTEIPKGEKNEIAIPNGKPGSFEWQAFEPLES